MEKTDNGGFKFDLSSPIKVLGIIAIIHYLYTHPPIQFNPAGIIPYCLILALGFLGSRLLKRNQGNYPSKKEIYLQSREFFKQKPRRMVTFLLLVAGEDGIFVLPLLYLGVTPVSAAIAAILFSLSHYLQWAAWGETRQIYGAALAYFLVIMYILPMGILTVCISHIIYDTLVVLYAEYKYGDLKTAFRKK